jgi:hypothetical protein
MFNNLRVLSLINIEGDHSADSDEITEPFIFAAPVLESFVETSAVLG